MDVERSEIYTARSLHRQLKELLKTQERGAATEKTMREIRRLCDGVVQAVADPFCQERVCEVERLADELIYLDKRSRWSRGTQPGAMLLRRLAYRALDALEERLRSLQKLRATGGGAIGIQ